MSWINGVKGHATGVTMQMGQNRWGTVANVRNSDEGYDVKVIVQPDEVASAWIPVLVPFGGSGWGFVGRPSIDMQALLLPDTGDGAHVICCGMAYSNANPPPKCPADFQAPNTQIGDGEFAMVSRAGACIRFCLDGSVYCKTPVFKIEGAVIIQGNLTVEEGGDGGGNIQATQNINADLNVTAGVDIVDAHGQLNRLRINYDVHHHGNSGPPTPQDSE